MKNNIVAVFGCGRSGYSPVMPYIGERIDGDKSVRLLRHMLTAALLRCELSVYSADTDDGMGKAQAATIRLNADVCVFLTFSAFGSRRTFNDERGITVCCYGPPAAGEDVAARLFTKRVGRVMYEKERALPCPAVKVYGGYLTCFDEAKLICDPDYLCETAELVAAGLCEYLDVPYRRRDDMSCYPLIGAGRRGKSVALLQCLLDINGYSVETDGVFGAETERAVRTLSAANGKPGGVVTPELWRDLLLTTRHNVVFGSVDNAVLYLQRKLRSKLYRASDSGRLDDNTLSAINDFCSDCGLKGATRDGDISPEIYDAICSVGGGKPRLI